MIGQTLAHYRITAALGAGGMGEVYRATDTKLNREVAIKVLPSDLAQDPHRLERFEREAHLLAALNHPNIAAIYGLEEADGRSFLVLELVDGEDLKERLARGAIPVDEGLKIAKQVAEGLEEAHAKAIVHRDLKPANVKLTPDGKVKVLDFGLAKAWSGEGNFGGSSSSASMSQSPTLAPSGTQAGVILGTAAYMSPEQARGKGVDKRGDIWAFGVLLWEMLTGETLFTGDGVTEILAAVMRDHPDWSKLPPTTPPSVRRLLRRCLEKDPHERIHDIADARLELEDVLGGRTEESGFVAPPGQESGTAESRRHVRQKWIWAASGLLVGGLAAALFVSSLTKVAEAPPRVHFTFEAPREATGVPAVSPDGRNVAFTGEGASPLRVRALDSPEARALPGTDGAKQAFWSPDGAWIAFFSGSSLNRIRQDGGRVHRICALPRGSTEHDIGDAGRGGTWGEGDIIVFTNRGGLYMVPAGGGDTRLLTGHDASRGETSHAAPRFLPGGRELLFVVEATEDENAGLHLTTLANPQERRRLLPRNARAVYASGHLLFLQNTTLRAQPFDTRTLQVSGESTPVAPNTASSGGLSDWGLFDVAPQGVLAYRERTRRGNVQLAWLDRNGRRLGKVGKPGPYGQIALSPDGRRVAVEIQDERGDDLWVMDVVRGVASRAATDPGKRVNPVWSPDSQTLAFSATDGLNIHQRGLERGASEIPLVETAQNTWPEDWSRDGKTLFYVTTDALWALPLADPGVARAVSKTTARQAEPRLSPDGRWLTYISQESGTWEVYVEPYGRPGERVLVSVDGGGQPKWRQDGKELFYLAFPEHWLMAVEVSAGADRIEVGLPRKLFELEDVNFAQSADYGVDPSGQRFLVKVPVGEPIPPRIHVITNWPSLLEVQ